LAITAGLESNVGPKGPIVNRNHVFHPRADVLAGGDGCMALLNARCQDVLVDDHDDYHIAYTGPPLPRTPLQRAGKIILCAADYIPEDALAVQGGSRRIVRLTEAQQTRLRTSGEVRVISPSEVQSFLRRLALDQQIEGVTPAMIDHFLKLDSAIVSEAREQEQFADLFLSKITARIAAPIEGAYSFGHKRRLIAPDLPPWAADFTKSFIVRSRKHVRGMVQAFARKLEAQREGRIIAPYLGSVALE
jgi:hypothetical protein